jgi:hypothetical protein
LTIGGSITREGGGLAAAGLAVADFSRGCLPIDHTEEAIDRLRGLAFENASSFLPRAIQSAVPAPSLRLLMNFNRSKGAMSDSPTRKGTIPLHGNTDLK